MAEDAQVTCAKSGAQTSFKMGAPIRYFLEKTRVDLFDFNYEIVNIMAYKSSIDSTEK